MPKKASAIEAPSAPEPQIETCEASPVMSAARFFETLFAAYAANQGNLLSAQRIPLIAGRGIMAYAAYLGAMDAIGYDISEARKAMSAGFLKHGVKFLTLGEQRAAEQAEKDEKEARVRAVEAQKSQKAAEIAARAMGPGAAQALLDVVNQARGVPAPAARTSEPATVGADDWGGA